MKCIYCGSDTKYKDRSKQNACVSCKHPFAYEPRTDSLKVTDGLFQRIIKDVSGDQNLSFTERQLWYEFNRRLLRKRYWRGPWGKVAGACGFGGFGLTIPMIALGPAAVIPVAVGACGVTYAFVMNNRARKMAPVYADFPFAKFAAEYLLKWTHAHGKIEKMLPPVDRHPPKPAQPSAQDVTAYSFDRALVTDRAETAAMLVANNFHFENNCAILSADGYPFHIAETVMTMLRRNPSLKVFALHDASATGCALPQTLRQAKWFSEPAIQVIDLGLRPQHAQKSRLLLLQEEATLLSDEQRKGLTQTEITWLQSGNIAEVACMRPAKLMRAVYQGFARANQIPSGADSSAGGIDDSTTIFIWSHDSGADVYAADSFG